MVKRKQKKVKRIEDYSTSTIDYSSILKKCMSDCKRWKIPISKNIKKEVSFIKRSDCYALCERLRSGIFRISFTTAGFEEYGISETAIYNLFMHELCHTIEGCFNHLKEWKFWVKKLNGHGCKINPYPFGHKKEYEGYF